LKHEVSQFEEQTNKQTTFRYFENDNALIEIASSCDAITRDCYFSISHIQSTFWLQLTSLWYVEGTAELVKDFLLLHILCKLLINSYITLISAEAHTSSSMHQDLSGGRKKKLSLNEIL